MVGWLICDSHVCIVPRCDFVFIISVLGFFWKELGRRMYDNPLDPGMVLQYGMVEQSYNGMLSVLSAVWHCTVLVCVQNTELS